MRVKAYLEVPKEISIFYRRSFLSLIKKALEKEDENYANNLFKKKNFKPFTFCVFFENIKINGETLQNNGKAIMTVSSGSPDFFHRFYNGLKKLKEYNGKYTNGTVKIRKVLMFEEEQISSPKQTFRTLSPIVVINRDKKPVLPSKLGSKNDDFILYDDGAFTQELRYSLKCIFNGLPELKFQHRDGKKSVVKHIVGNKENEKVIKIVAYQGVFTLEGDPYVLNEVYKYGLGFRRYQGFGCLELVKEN